MAWLTDIRTTFLDYFERNGHEVVPSSPLVPRNDPTLMFANSGMVQFKNLFTGVETATTSAPPAPRNASARAASTTTSTTSATPRGTTPSSRCWATSASATTSRTHAIPFAWELITREFGIDPKRLLVTVYHTDEEAAAIWRKVGLPDERIIRIPTDDNFWMMGPTGPCGPCSEIFYDHGEDIPGRPARLAR